MPRLTHFRVPTDIPGTHAYQQPPDDFDPLSASDNELIAFGFPIRPGKGKTRGLYPMWERIVGKNCRRVIPKLITMDRGRGLGKAIGETRRLRDSAQMQAMSTNWSGCILQDPTNPWGGSQAVVQGSWTVPVTNCVGVPNDGTSWSRCCQWVGFDGWNENSPFLFQCGVETDQPCAVAFNFRTRYFWYEWLPGNQVQVDLAVDPGDKVAVTAFVNPGPVYCFGFANETKDIGATISVQPVGGQHVLGNSVEWIVERTTVNDVVGQLANYGEVRFSAIAWSDSAPTVYSRPGSSPSGTLIEVTMVQGGDVVSAPTLAGAGAGFDFACTAY